MVRMDITPYVDRIRHDLLSAAGTAGDDARDLVERLGYALEPSARLALMEAVAQAAAEITSALPEQLPVAGVDVRLDGRDLDFTVHPAAPIAPTAARASEPEADDTDDGSVVRLTLRLPEALKGRAEEAASAAGQSLNTWLVNAVRAATHADAAGGTGGAVRVDVDLSSIPFAGGFPFGGRNQRRMTGWA